MKASEGSRGPFLRQLTATYTAATIEAGDRADVGEPSAAPSGSSWTSSALSAHLLVITEGPELAIGERAITAGIAC